MALAEELDNLEINIGNICFGSSDRQCITLMSQQIQAQVGNGNIQHSGESDEQNQGWKNSKDSQSCSVGSIDSISSIFSI